MQVTFIIATYRRVDALSCTLRALLLQTHEDWRAVVVGDHCGPETEHAIRAVGDARISYYNLPERFGEQSGPNNLGLRIANGDALAFLNHDDLLLPDHLEIGLGALAHAEFFIGCGADATQLQRAPDGSLSPVFTRRLPAHDDLAWLTLPSPYLFDPSSFWLVRTSYAKAVGDWRPAATLWRTPLRDWLMRAWRQGGRFEFGDRISGLRFWTQNLRQGVPLYDNDTPEHELMLQAMRQWPTDALRAGISRQIDSALAQAPDADAEAPKGWTESERARLAARYLETGFDEVVARRQADGEPPGGVLNEISRRRTGQGLPASWDMATVLADPERCRVL